MTIKVFSSEDFEAPVLSFNNSTDSGCLSFISIIRAVFITGYGNTLPVEGWNEVEFGNCYITITNTTSLINYKVKFDSCPSYPNSFGIRCSLFDVSGRQFVNTNQDLNNAYSGIFLTDSLATILSFIGWKIITDGYYVHILTNTNLTSLGYIYYIHFGYFVSYLPDYVTYNQPITLSEYPEYIPYQPVIYTGYKLFTTASYTNNLYNSYFCTSSNIYNSAVTYDSNVIATDINGKSLVTKGNWSRLISPTSNIIGENLSDSTNTLKIIPLERIYIVESSVDLFGYIPGLWNIGVTITDVFDNNQVFYSFIEGVERKFIALYIHKRGGVIIEISDTWRL